MIPLIEVIITREGRYFVNLNHKRSQISYSCRKFQFNGSYTHYGNTELDLFSFLILMTEIRLFKCETKYKKNNKMIL